MATTYHNFNNCINIVTLKHMNTYKDINTSVFLLLSLTTARAFSFQSSTLNSDILKQVISASNSIVEDEQVNI